MKRYILFAVVIVSPFATAGQTMPGDSILANERSIDRPVTLHARQMRITGGYDLAVIEKRVGASQTVHLTDESTSSMRHRLYLDLRYGINDFLQFNAAIGYSSNMVREQTQFIIPDETSVVSNEIVHEYKGLEDLYVGLDLRAPLKTRKVDIALTLGATLPVAKFKPSEPDHRFTAVQENGTNMHRFVYHYNYAMGTGVVIGQVGGIVKYRAASWAISARIDYQHGFREGSGYKWHHQLDGGAFEYREHPFTYRLPDTNAYHIEGEYQPLRWLDLFMIVSGFTGFDGWISTQENLKVATPYQTTWALSPGFEIIVSPRLWVRERINFTVAGKNREVPFSFQTTLMYNFFPVK